MPGSFSPPHPRWNLGGLLTLSIVLTGCLVSLDPVVTASDALFDPRLLGRWKMESGEYAVIASADSQKYEIRVTDGGHTALFEARLGMLGGRLVLDVRAAPEAEGMKEYELLVIRAHFLYVVDPRDGELYLASFNREMVRTAVRNGEVHLEIKEHEDSWIMLDDTRQLRAALGALISRPGMLDEDGKPLRRAPESGGS